ncbi:MAG: DUF975 family protein [Oscillospiraceae bacterium]|nr:DUF975 family protein [Oscillospiraceae bacterium]
MKINRAAIKQNAKSIITTAKPSPILVGLAYLGIILILQLLSYTVTGEFQIYMKYMDQIMAGNIDYIPAMVNISVGSRLMMLAISLMILMIDTGFTVYCLNICQFRKSGIGNLFDGCAIFFKVLLLFILTGIIVFLWSLLFIIPGIIAFYRYRQALYIMIDNPQLGVLDCIKASSEMMNGRKGELFLIDLSFLGWALLTLFPFVTIWVTPYTSVTYANYYLALRDMPHPNLDVKV